MGSDEDAWVVTEQEVEAFQRDGAIRLRGVFNDRWLKAVQAGIQANLKAPSQYSEFLASADGAGRFFDDYCNWRQIPEFRDFVYESPASRIAAELMRSETAVFYHEHVLVKEPGALNSSPWHQDQPYYPVDGQHVCSIWMPIDPVPVETAVQFVRGSHAWGRWFIPRKFATANNYQLKDPRSDAAGYEDVPDVDGAREEYDILAWSLEPGDCLVFHGATVHGAPGNRSTTTPRRALASRWLGDDARFTERPWQISPPITGGLSPGDPFRAEEFPVVWPRA